jgi:hypothetical protein
MWNILLQGGVLLWVRVYARKLQAVALEAPWLRNSRIAERSPLWMLLSLMSAIEDVSLQMLDRG